MEFTWTQAFFSFVPPVVAAVLAYFFAKRDRTRKRIQILVRDDSKGVKIHQGIAGDIQILYKEQPVGDLQLFTFDVVSAGNSCVENFEVQIHSSIETNILGASKNDNITMKPSAGSQAILHFDFLNPGEAETITLFLDGDVRDVSFDFHEKNVEFGVSWRPYLEGGLQADANTRGRIAAVGLAFAIAAMIIGFAAFSRTFLS